MKKLTRIISLLSLFCFVFLPAGLFAQETLDLLTKLDKGLPPSGLNASNMGDIISCIGDVNNDGFDDWAVGFPNAADYETGATVGKVYIYFGSNSIQNNKNPDLILSGAKGTSNFGGLIFRAGDVNKDGYSDVLITKNRQVALYYGGNPMDTIPDVIFKDNNETGYFGVSASSAGDVNNDGFDDIIIGSRDFANIYFGDTNMDSQADIILKGEQEQDMFGFSVSKAGDVNKDGFDDVIVGAGGYYFNGYDAGRVYVYYGGAEMDTIADIVLTGEHAGDSFGSTVSDAGDLNNDGFDDFMVSAYRYQNINKDNGRVYVYYGGNTNDTIPDVIIYGSNGQSAGDINKDGFGDLLVDKSVYWGGSTMDSIADFNLTNVSRVAGSGDYNNDDFADILTGQPNYNNNGEFAGCVSIFYGGSQLHSNADVVFYGEPSSDYYGTSVSSAGDLNNDGYNDFIIGSPGNDQAGLTAGCALVYFGGKTISNEPDLTLLGQKEGDRFGESVSYAGDVNGDGFSDVIVSGFFAEKVKLYLGNNVMDNNADLTFKGGDSSRYFGNCVSDAGDFNNDGFSDIIIGDFCNYAKGTNTGRAYIYFGGASMDTNPDLTFEGEAIFNEFGNTVSDAGDVNNDGFSDIMIGAPRYDRTDLLGRLYIYYGSSSPDTIPDVVITGNKQYRQLGRIIATAGDVNKDGFDDIIVGLPYLGNGFDNSYVYIYYGGADMDTIPDVVIEKMAYGFGSCVSGAGDLNNDGFDDIMIGGSDKVYVYYGGLPMDTIPDLIINGEGRWADFGTSLSFAGDVNNDGHTDLLVGAPYSNAVGNNMGRAYVYSSKIMNTGSEIGKNLSPNQVYPNPFSTETTIKYNLKKSGPVLVKIFTVSGQEIETLVNSSQTTGEHQIIWHPDNLPNGIYFCKIQSSEFSETKKVLFQK